MCIKLSVSYTFIKKQKEIRNRRIQDAFCISLGELAFSEVSKSILSDLFALRVEGKRKYDSVIFLPSEFGSSSNYDPHFVYFIGILIDISFSSFFFFPLFLLSRAHWFSMIRKRKMEKE